MKGHRILLVTNLFPPDIGGPASFIPDLAEELTRQGYTATVACQSDTLSHPSDAARPYAVHRIQRMKYRLNRVWVALNLLWLVPRHNIIFCNTLDESLAPVCWFLRRQYLLKIVGDRAWEAARSQGLTDLSVEEFQKVSMPPSIARISQRQRAIAKRARLVIVPGESRRQLIIGWEIPPDRVITIPNGIRLDDFRSVEPNLRRGGPLQVLFVGRLIKLKGVDDLLDAVADLADVQLTIVGDGPEWGALRAKAVSSHAPVVFMGRVSREIVLQTMLRSHTLVLPSQTEGLSHTLLEGCASGLACIASDRGGNPEVIENTKNGLLISYGDTQALRAAIVRLRDNEDERHRLAQAAKQRSYDFDFQKTLRDTIKVLSSEAAGA